MRICLAFIVWLVGWMLPLIGWSQPTPSVLATGEWYKLGVIQTGIHKLDAASLRKMGISPKQINPQHLRLYGNGGGMLPQANAAPRPNDLTENAIYVVGEADGKFDDTDYVLFYAQRPHAIRYDTSAQTFSHQTHQYSDTAFYFLTVSDSPGLRVADQPGVSGSAHTITTFDDYAFHEKDLVNILHSGREWYGEKFDGALTHSVPFSLPGIVAGSSVRVTSSVMGHAPASTEFTVRLNNQDIGKQAISGVSFDRYAPKGVPRTDAFTLPAASNLSDLTVSLTYDKKGMSNASGYLNFVSVQVKRSLQLYGTQTAFRSLESQAYPAVNYVLPAAAQPIAVWDVSNPARPTNQILSTTESQVQFTAAGQSLREFVAFTGNAFAAPVSVQKIPNQDLHARPVPNLLIITHPAFIDQANRLADFRRQHDGLTADVVTVPQIYHEFSSGTPDITALRDFIRYLHRQNAGLQYVLLFGDASYDYKNRLPTPTNFVPVYESQESLHPVFSYSSDDYIGFMDDDEGEWAENHEGDAEMDVAVGRLPVKSPEEATIVVDKLLNYVQNPNAFGKWRNVVSFIADDGDGNTHQQDAERLASSVTAAHPGIDSRKIYLDAYPQTAGASGQSAPSVQKAIDQTIDRGSLLINYNGHGGEEGWAEEQILTIPQIQAWENAHQLPLFVTATCEFGRYDDPARVSGAEIILLHPKGGGIGLITTTRPVYANTNYALNKAFYETVFTPVNGKMPRLGDVVRQTKNNSLNGSVNRNFALLGDPSMQLAYPTDEAVITHVNGKPTSAGADTLKALQRITLTGQIQDRTQHNQQTDFDGTVYVSVFDKATTAQTAGTESATMPYSVQTNKIFEGKASVRQGAFSVEFIVPKDLDYRVGKCKIGMYAVRHDQTRDASGADTLLPIGGSADTITPDTDPPAIQLFMDDESFVNGGTTGSNTQLVAVLSDESGINIAQNGIGHEITATLSTNPEEILILNDYYTAETDSFRKGRVVYPFKNLPDGTYQLTLKAWDVHNNSAQASIEFVVTNRADIALTRVLNYPNPFAETTQFQFNHNRAGDDLDVQIDIFTTSGQWVQTLTTGIPASAGFVRNMRWDGRNANGEKLPAGVYVYRLRVRSMADNAQRDHTNRLVIIR